jgi:hypothetical protein
MARGHTHLFRRLAIIAALLASAQAQVWTGVVDPSRAVDWSTAGVSGGIPTRSNISVTLGGTSFGSVETFLNLPTATIGNTVTTGILNTGTTGGACTWALTGTSPKVGATQGTLGSAVTVGSTTFTPTTTTHSLAFDDGSNFSYARCDFTNNGQIVTISGYVTVNSANAGFSGNLWDKVRIDDNAGHYAVLQLNNGNGPSSCYCFNIETGPGTIRHSNYVNISVGGRYYFALQFNGTSLTASAALYNPGSFTQVGTTMTVAQFGGSPASRFYLGNVEVGTSAGNTDYFEDIMVSSNIHPFPALPSQNAFTIQPVTQTDIINALNAAAAGSVVVLGAGIYNITDAITITNLSNVTLQGVGADQASIVISGGATACGTGSPVAICVRATDSNFKTSITNGPVVVSGTLTKGSTTITLASVPNLKVGNPIIIDQLDSTQDDGSPLVTDSTTTLTAVAPGITGPYSIQGNSGGAQRSGRQQEQIVTVTQCDGSSIPAHACASGANITISPGLYMANWSSTPQAWWASSPSTGIGIEGLTIDSTANGLNSVGIGFYNAMNSWVKGVRSIDSARAHVQLVYSPRITIRDSYFYLTQNWTTSSYGFESYSGSDALVENNIFHGIASPQIFNGPCSGCVIGYNFSVNNFYNGSLFNQNAHGEHTSGVDSFLIEGNVGNSINADVIHGTHNFGTIFRNRYSGPQSQCWQSSSNTTTSVTAFATATYGTCNSNTQPISLDSFTRFYNVIGNVLGTTGVNTVYESNTNNNPTLRLGGGNGAVPNDPNVQPTAMIWGNAVSSNGFAPNIFSSSEVPSALTGTQAAYSNPVPVNNQLPNSFYYSAKPAWWPATKAWPPIGPDVSGGNITGVNGKAYTIPAQDCFINIMGGNSNGTGLVLTFNSSSCYSSSTVPIFSQVNGVSISGAVTIH